MSAVPSIGCPRCTLTFTSVQALLEHERESPNHHECPICPFDGRGKQDLLDHLFATGHAWVCHDCNDGLGAWFTASSNEWYDHMKPVNGCGECGLHFDNPQELKLHDDEYHYDPVWCGPCEQDFSTMSGIIQHAESGACLFGGNYIHVNFFAATSAAWSHVMGSPSCHRMLGREELWGERHFWCPGDCGRRFERLSAMIMHAERGRCGVSVDEGLLEGLIQHVLERWE